MPRKYNDESLWPDEDNLAVMGGEAEEPPPVYVISELGQVAPPDYPFKWAEKAYEERPPSPEAEFVSSPYPIELQVLARRWKGIYTYEEVEQSYFQGNWRAKRFNHQDAVSRRAVESSLAADVMFRRIQINQSIIELSAIKERLVADLEAGYEYDRSTNAGPMGYVKRPLSVKSKSTLASAIVMVDNALMTRIGVATQIHEENFNVRVGVTQSLRETLTERDDEYAMLLDIAERASSDKFSDPPALGKGDSIHDVREQFNSMPVGTEVGGKLYEVEPQ